MNSKSFGGEPVIEIVEPGAADELFEFGRIVHQVRRLEDRGVRHVLPKEQRVGELDDRGALTHHFADIGLRAELVGGEDCDVDAAVGAFLEAVGERSHRGMGGVSRGERMAEPELEFGGARFPQSHEGSHARAKQDG